MKLFFIVYAVGSIVSVLAILWFKRFVTNRNNYDCGQCDFTIKQAVLCILFSWIAVVWALSETLEEIGFWNKKIFKFRGNNK
jgi:hypothetical protein